MPSDQTKTPIFAVAKEKEISILSAINMQARKLCAMKTFDRLGINAANIMWCKSINSLLLKDHYRPKNRNIC